MSKHIVTKVAGVITGVAFIIAGVFVLPTAVTQCGAGILLICCGLAALEMVED